MYSSILPALGSGLALPPVIPWVAVMLQKLGDHIANCLALAAEAEQRAAEAPTEALRIDYERMTKSWRHLASSYQFVETLERFLLDADKARRDQHPEPASQNGGRALLRGTAFEPKTIAALIGGWVAKIAVSARLRALR
jgi:hypothetical protein